MVRFIAESLLDPARVPWDSHSCWIRIWGAGQLNLGESLAQNGGQSNSNIEMPLPSGTTLAREYLWGPGDRGTDEMLAQFDTTGKPWYPIQDGGGDIVALVDPYGGGRVAAQFVYDPYGSVLSAEHFYAHPYLHAGHKGLFIERLDQPNVDTGTMTEIPRLVPLATNYVHMRIVLAGLLQPVLRDLTQICVTRARVVHLPLTYLKAVNALAIERLPLADVKFPTSMRVRTTAPLAPP